ncbi:MAG: apolipoprotein N-acyltransferase [Phycisphaerae bacterium]
MTKEPPPPEIFLRRLQLARRTSVALLSILSVVLLSVSFAPFNQWYLAYVALVPWLMALEGGMSRRWTLLWAALAGLLFWGANLYWLTWVTIEGYVATVLYLSLYWLVAGWIIRAAGRRNLPLWLVLPVVWVSLEFLRTYVISGFPWFFLAQSQYARTHLIQIADVTGQYGLSFFVAMVNGAIMDLLTFPLFARVAGGGARMCRWAVAGLLTTAGVGLFILGYGAFRLGQHTTHEGPVIGLVQHAYPNTLRGREAPAKEIFDHHLRSSEAFIGAGCDLVVWPETMLPGGMNREFLDFDPAQLSPDGQAYLPGVQGMARQLGQLSQRLGCPILAGGVSYHLNPDMTSDRLLTVRNSALWFDATDRPTAMYSKMHLVPFGEYVPFKQGWPALHKFLRGFVPSAMEQLDPGLACQEFRLRRGEKTWSLATPICFEGTFADICRQMVVSEGAKRVDILANMSNDGWFVYDWGSSHFRGSTEHAQHLSQYCFRAVEARTPVIRAVNTGISASVDSSGRIQATVQSQGQRAMVIGTLLLDGARGGDGQWLSGHGPKVLVDDRVSLYSLVGDVFAWAVSGGGCVLALWLAWKKRTEKKDKQ